MGAVWRNGSKLPAGGHLHSMVCFRVLSSMPLRKILSLTTSGFLATSLLHWEASEELCIYYRAWLNIFNRLLRREGNAVYLLDLVYGRFKLILFYKKTLPFQLETVWQHSGDAHSPRELKASERPKCK